jgi:hypothetical protein
MTLRRRGKKGVVDGLIFGRIHDEAPINNLNV